METIKKKGIMNQSEANRENVANILNHMEMLQIKHSSECIPQPHATKNHEEMDIEHASEPYQARSAHPAKSPS